MFKNVAVIIIVIILGYICFCLLGWQSLLAGVFMTVISILLALAYEDFGNPSITVTIQPPIKIGDSIYLRIKVTNNPPKIWPFITRKTALSCHGTLSFYNSKFERYLLEEAKWTGNPEPIHLSDQKRIILEPSLLRLARYIDIPADETEEMDICFRDSIDRDAYLWNSDSYIPNYTHAPKRRLAHDDSYLLINIKHSFGSKKFIFKLKNPQEIEDFMIKKIDAKELKIIKTYLK